MEPSCTNLSLPRFASNRHGFELAIHQVRLQRSRRLDNDPDHAGYRCERASSYSIT
jgi:hypothetical protein